MTLGSLVLGTGQREAGRCSLDRTLRALGGARCNCGVKGGPQGSVRDPPHLGRLPTVNLVPCAQLAVAVVSLHEDPPKFIHQPQMVVAEGATEHLRGRERAQG